MATGLPPIPSFVPELDPELDPFQVSEAVPPPEFPVAPRPMGPPPMEMIPPPDFVPEVPQYLPPSRPSPFETTFSPFGNTAALAAMMRRGAPPGAFLLAGLLHGLGQQAQRRRAVDEEQRQEMNRRFETAAAFRNRANLAASGRREAMRLSAMHRESERARAKAERDLERTRIDAGLARDLGLGVEWINRPIDDLPPELKSKPLPRVSLVTVPGPDGQPVTVRAPASLAAPKASPLVTAGPEIPTLSGVEADLSGRQRQMVATARDVNLPPPPAADSLASLARGVRLVHDKLRQAQTTAEVDSLVSLINQATDTPEPIKAQLREGAAFRRKQVANAGRTR